MSVLHSPRWRAGVALVLSVVLASCGSDAPTPFAPATGSDAAGRFWSLTLNYQAVTLSTVAPYDTIRIVATPRDASGHAIEGLGPISFRSLDSSRVRVTPDGVLHAVRTGSNVTIQVSLSAGGVTHLSDVSVTVTNVSSPPVLAHIDVFPTTPDSNPVPIGGDGTFLSITASGDASAFAVSLLAMSLTDTAGNPISNINVAGISSDSSVLQAFPQGTLLFLGGIRPGRADVILTATAYGVTVADTIPFMVTMPIFDVVKIAQRPTGLSGAMQPTFVSPDIVISPGGTVVWANVSGEPVDIVFDDPTNVVDHGAISCANAGVTDVGGTGSIDAFGVPQDTSAATLDPENCRSRGFPVPGTYTYHSTHTAATGRIVVSTGLSNP